MKETKEYCDHCRKVLDKMKDYGDTDIIVLTCFKADLCEDCIEELDNIVLEFCGKKVGAE